jgi:seryl-tRNA synthetase
MLDIQVVRNDPELVVSGLKRKGVDADVFAIWELDKQWRMQLSKADTLRHQRNTVSHEISQMAKEGKDFSTVREQMKAISDEIKALEESLRELEGTIHDKMLWLPNLPHSTAPCGLSSEDNVEVHRWGEDLRTFDFPLKDHLELGKSLDILDFSRGAKVAGSGFPLYKGLGATLERALLNFMLDVQVKERGYREVLPPFMVNRESMIGTGQLPKLANDMYHCPVDDLFLIPTAEVPITNMHRDEIFSEDDLPVRYAGYTACFRLADAENILKKLEIPYRVMELCAGDLSFSAAKCYDIEVWAPAEKAWLEASSCSNFEDFQARRMNIRFRSNETKKTGFVHTLNGSGLATSRLMVALLENYQTDEGTIAVPEMLRPYLGETMIGLPK